MKIFLSAVEGNTAKKAIDEIISSGIKLHYNLMSYYYIAKSKFYENAVHIRDNSELIMIDSGAHSFQFGAKVNWLEYTQRYAEFIKQFDRPNVVGYFEMDIDNIIGYEKVLELRKILENVSDKIIPVWHPPRGINNYEEMCKKYHGKIIAIGGFRGTDIKDHQYIMFLKVAKKYNCKVHCLGMTRTKILDKVPFDYTDSSTWLTQANFGNVYYGKGKFPKARGDEKQRQFKFNYMQGMKKQEYYYKKWKRICND
ncbi:MAG: hypothetical protein GX800_05590 [Clostridiaceae bacterium]|nr:hypothetical protein [Clostridiaceae bacterium]